VDNEPGDRLNVCHGIYVPYDIELNKKGKVIVYKCLKCGQIHKNICANDDDFETILKIMNKTYNYKDYLKKD